MRVRRILHGLVEYSVYMERAIYYGALGGVFATVDLVYGFDISMAIIGSCEEF